MLRNKKGWGEDKPWSRAQHVILTEKGEGGAGQRERERRVGRPKERKRKGREEITCTAHDIEPGWIWNLGVDWAYVLV